MAGEPPAGRQVELRLGSQRAVVVEVGGGVREYRIGDWDVLDGYPVGRMADGARGQPLLPWPNRLADGQYEFEGESLQLPIDEVERHNAIHGLTRWVNWTVEEQSAERVRLGVTLHPRPGYPFSLRLHLEYTLTAAGLTVHTTARNIGDRALPFGAGQHPYLTVDRPSIDSAVLQMAAASRLELNPERRLPTGRLIATADTEFDFRYPRAIGPLVIDECFTDLGRDTDGRCHARLSDDGGGRQVDLWADAPYRYLQVFTGDTLAPQRRRRGLAIEPMTCPPNAFRTGTDLQVLAPGESCQLTWGLTCRL
ncbi:MAG TPA: aldose 1-epimerase family protein [Chloroflexota bacterium]|nr:aldose 1-epimerase family protein [Chloroflexota bacterium]